MDEARSSLDRAFPMLSDLAKAEPDNLRYRNGLAYAWETLGRVQARAGRKSEAVEAATASWRWAKNWPDRRSLFVRPCPHHGPRRSSSQSDATAAIAALRRVIEAGFDNAHLLRTDPRLESLRSRPDFPVLNAVRS